MPATPARHTTLLAFAAYALILLLAPLLWRGGLALGMLTQMGYLSIICLSYNMLLGQGGMLSFGHAVYVGLAGFAAIHVLNWSGAQASAGAPFVPVALIPLVGGLAGAWLAVLLGYLNTRHAGTPFAMITLGVGELVSALALMLPGWFGGEGGIGTDRVIGQPVAGISFGPAIEVYYLVAAYALVCTALMYAFTHTPLGRMLNAVRDNPERAAFVGYDPRRVRYLAFIASGFFAGIGGALMVLHLEIITAMDSLSTTRSGAYLLFTFLGGAGFFFGPIIGAVLMVLGTIWLSELTQAWMLYLGLLFLLMVMFAPGGMAGLLARGWQRGCHAWRNARQQRWPSWRQAWARALPPLALWSALTCALAGLAVLVEMLYHRQLNAVLGEPLLFMGLTLDVHQPRHWLLAALWLAGWAGLAGAIYRCKRYHITNQTKNKNGL